MYLTEKGQQRIYFRYFFNDTNIEQREGEKAIALVTKLFLHSTYGTFSLVKIQAESLIQRFHKKVIKRTSPNICDLLEHEMSSRTLKKPIVGCAEQLLTIEKPIFMKVVDTGMQLHPTKG